MRRPLAYWVRCSECEAETALCDSRSDAIAAWNRRVTQNIGKADICRECELASRNRELERRLSEMAIEVVGLMEENRVLKLRLKEEESD